MNLKKLHDNVLVRPQLNIHFWGNELHLFTMEDFGETNTWVTINYYRAHQHGALQVHPEKDEFNFLYDGSAIIWLGDRETKELKGFIWEKGTGYYVPRGTVHKITAVTDCVIINYSQGVKESRLNVEEEFKNSTG